MSQQKNTLALEDSTNFIRNGNFSQGLAYWHGSFLEHQEVSVVAEKSDNCTQFAVQLDIVPSNVLVEGTNTGISQYIDRPDIASYPSVRRINGLQFLPVADDTVFVKVIPGFTSVNETLLESAYSVAPVNGVIGYKQEFIFQHPFLFTQLLFKGAVSDLGSTTSSQESDYEFIEVPIMSGSSFIVSDYTRPENSGEYRVNKLLYNYEGFVGSTLPPLKQNPFLPPFHTYKYHGLLAKTSGGSKIASLLNNASEIIAFSTITVESGVVSLVIFGDTDQLEQLVRGTQIEEVGILIGDCVSAVVNGVQTTGLVSSVIVEEDSIILELQSLTNYGNTVYPFFSSAGEPDSWNIFIPSYGAALRELPLFSVDLSVSLSYHVSGEFAEPGASFLEAVDVVGSGVGNTLFKLKPATNFTKYAGLPLTDGSLDQSLVRRLERFSFESAKPVTGRWLYRLSTQSSVELTGQQLAPSSLILANQFTTPSLSSTNHVVFVTQQGAAIPQEWFPGDVFKADSFLAPIPEGFGWVQTLINQPYITISAVEEAPDPGNPSVKFVFLSVEWDTDLFGPFPGVAASAFVAAQYGVAFVLKEATPVLKRALVSDIHVSKQDQSAVLDREDSTLAPIEGVLSSEHSIDPGIVRIDPFESIIPKGASILFGNGFCPPGFVSNTGILSKYVQQLPAPDSATYDADLDRTSLFWDRSFSAVDENGALIPLTTNSFNSQVSVTGLPGSFETIDIPSYQSSIVPGMSLSVRRAVQESVLESLVVSSEPGKAARLQGSGHIRVSHVADFNSSHQIEMWVRLLPGQTINDIPTAGYPLVSKFSQVGQNKQGYQILLKKQGVTAVVEASWFGKTSLGTSTVAVGTASASGIVTDPSSYLFIKFRVSVTDSSVSFLPAAVLTVQNLSQPSSSANINPSYLSGEEFATITNSSNLFIGADNLGASQASIVLDDFRVFKSSISLQQYDGYNGGQGKSYLTEAVKSLSFVLASFDDTPIGGKFTNNAPESLSLVEVIGNISSVTGLLKAILQIGTLNTEQLLASLEHKPQSVFVSDVVTENKESTNVAILSGIAGQTSAVNQKGQGSVVYPFLFLTSGGQTGVLPQEANYKPVGPSAADQTEVFADGLPYILNVLNTTDPEFTIVANTVGPTIVSLKVQRIENITVGASTAAWQPTVGDVVFFKYTTATTQQTYGWVARVEAVKTGSKLVSGFTRIYTEITISRYDKNPITLPFVATNTNISKAQAQIVPARLFGQGQHVFNSDGSIFIPKTSINLISLESTSYWSVRALSEETTVVVVGKLELAVDDSIYLNASGYLRYETPKLTIDYGTGLHSHKILNVDGASSNLIPRVEEPNATTPFTTVASNHSHGFMSRAVYSLPRFLPLNICTKL